MKVRRLLPIIGVSLALSVGLGLGLVLSVWAGTMRLPYVQRPEVAHAAQVGAGLSLKPVLIQPPKPTDAHNQACDSNAADAAEVTSTSVPDITGTSTPTPVNLPHATSTPVLLDLAGKLTWDGGFSCPDPVL